VAVQDAPRGEHWDGVYAGTDDTRVSWYEAAPDSSLAVLDAAGVTPAWSVVDVGAGASRLADELVARGHDDVTALDVSSRGLERTRARLRADAPVRFVVADVVTWTPGRTFDVWHDRAVLHFLVEEADRDRYRDVVAAAVAPGGLAVIGTFAPDGPATCSGLPVVRYGPDDLARLLDGLFTPVTTRRVEHRTPWGAVQPFTWVAARRA